MEEENYEVQLARDGKDGYLAYLLFKPDLVITDIQMPERNGLKLMEIIRKHNPEVKTINLYQRRPKSVFNTSRRGEDEISGEFSGKTFLPK